VQDSLIAMIITAAILLVVTVAVVLGGRGKRPPFSMLRTGASRASVWTVWFLTGIDLVSAFSLFGLPGYGYAGGVPALVAALFTVLAFPWARWALPRLVPDAQQAPLSSLAGFVQERFRSRSLGVMVALTGVVCLLFLVVSQLRGISGVVQVEAEGILPPETVAAACLLLAVCVAWGGWRSAGYAAIVKDIFAGMMMVWLAVTLPSLYFGGWGRMVHAVLAAHPAPVMLPDIRPWDSAGAGWFVSSALVSAVAWPLWPHVAMGAFMARSADAIRKNSLGLLFYTLPLVGITFLGIAARLVLPDHRDPSLALWTWVRESYPAPLQGLVDAMVVLACLITASRMLAAMADLFVNQVVGGLFGFHIGAGQQAWLERLTVLGAAAIAVATGFLLPDGRMGPQVWGTSGIVQIFPAVVLSRFGKPVSGSAVMAGLLAGLGCLVLDGFFPWPGYPGIWGMAANLVMVVLWRWFASRKF
jgi:SSS family solute:Na+ symporter